MDVMWSSHEPFRVHEGNQGSERQGLGFLNEEANYEPSSIWLQNETENYILTTPN